MTQPVQEPTQGRTDQRQDFGTRQLFRRPAPPGSTGIGHGFPVDHSIEGREWDSYLDTTANDGFDPIVIDTTAPFGAYIDSTPTNTDGTGIYIGVGPLGYGTGWGMDLWLRKGPDEGILLIEFGTTPVDELTTASLGSNWSIVDPDEAAFSGWFTTDNPSGAIGDKIDLYDAVATTWDAYKMRGLFYVNGADGQMLTADGTFPADTWVANAEFLAGGDASVAWWVKFRSYGKNAASSGYGLRMAGFRMYRVNGNGLPVS